MSTVPMSALSVGDVFSYGAGANEAFLVKYVSEWEIGGRRVNPDNVVDAGPIEKLARTAKSVTLRSADVVEEAPVPAPAPEPEPVPEPTPEPVLASEPEPGPDAPEEATESQEAAAAEIVEANTEPPVKKAKARRARKSSSSD